MSQQNISILKLSLVAAGTIARGRFVTGAGVQAGAQAKVLGVADCDATSGKDVGIDTIGTAVVEAGGAFAADIELETDANGKAVARTTGPVVARSLPGQSSSGAGQFVEVLLIPSTKLLASYSMLYFVQDLGAGADIAGQLMHKARQVEVTSKVVLFSRGAPAGIDDANPCLVEVKKGAAIVASFTFDTANVFPAAGSAQELTLGTLADRTLAIDDTLTVAVTSGAAANPPAFDLEAALI